ncbi:hypothetical protein HYW83_00540 [Candidatus Peregrinibacteria bacterium]|nr:hypothetical protein [Candidatus Peregrinibacteria bacterium]
MDQHSKHPLITKQLIVVCGAVLLLFAAIAYIGFRIAQRDATFEADFWFKWFGASAAIFFAFVGPFGLIGFWAMSSMGSRPKMLGKIQGLQNSPEKLAAVREKVLKGDTGGGLVYRLIFGVICSIALTAWVLYRFNAYSLFFVK